MSNSSLRHLRAFQLVAKLQNVRKAAEAVHLTQPAVTLAIAKIESQMGAVLFERSSRGTYMTSAGKILAARVDRMFDQIDEALASVDIHRGNTASYAAVIDRITRPQVRALCSVASGDLANIDESAISRASIYRSARELEKCLGKALMVRTVNGLTVTEAGATLGRRLSLALQEITSALEEILAEENRGFGELRIGAMPLSGSFVVGPVLNDLTLLYPEATLEVKVGEIQQLTTDLQHGDIDMFVGILSGGDDMAEIEREHLVVLPYVIVARSGHPLTRKSDLTYEDLEGYDWVAPGPHAARRATFDLLIGNLRRKPNTIQVTSLATMRLLLSGCDRLALVTRFELEQERELGTLVELPFGPIEPMHSLGIARRANWMPTPLHQKFIELVRRQAGKIIAAKS
ncbi:LysR substrate-binding domain-containing protein [Rhizobium sp. 1AS11]|uniref:LysR substrate-binding domain-containing protein n=1 Tax=Rhizobium acaciae TaxID=2989736 RepID=UPI00222220FC|nr:LysR substrate-binding domain-containing protein [Rhizobium acaciae]MCW1411315.1 LysR substrate-binding domain-containing protein [Rhizobium acaciae]MCW1743273.1 LysR substrate-binding domain-containing protein [Rhizobium acaciae]